MKTCMFTGMFRRRSFEEAIEMAAKIGYQAVELRMAAPHFPPDITDAELAARGRRIADLGLEAASLYTFIGGFSTASDEECDASVARFGRMLEAAQLLGADMVKIGTGGPNAFLAREYHFAKSAHYLGRCAEMAAQACKRVLLEIHNESLIEDLDHALKLHEMIGSAHLGFIHDAANMAITGEDFGAQSVARLGATLFHVHVKDVARVKDASLPDTFVNRTRNGSELFRLVPLGSGQADHRPLFAALKAAGYEGYASTEANLSVDDEAMTCHEYAEMLRQMRG